jgi:hypothetical protein
MEDIRRSWGQRVLIAGSVAAVGSILAQLAFTLDERRRWPRILMRDSRMTAAVVLGPAGLTRRTPPARALLAATLIHFLVAGLDTAAVALLIARLRRAPVLMLGALYGLAAYGARLYVLAPLYPWMRRLRTPSYLLTHVAHGIIIALALGRR